MKTSLIAGIGTALFALTGLSHAEYGIYRGTTVNTFQLYSYDGTATTVKKTSRTDIQIGVSSTLGNDFYALYTLDKKAKIAYQYQGEYDGCGPSIYLNIAGKGKSLEVHPQFNARWWDDIADVGDTKDVMNYKSGYLQGNRTGIKLKQAAFTITAASVLSGLHTHTRWSKDFRPDPLVMNGYLPGNFFELNSSKSTFRFDANLSDKANYLGGSLANGIATVDAEMARIGYTVVPLGAFPNF